jgi:hypothetical protein
MVQNNFRITNFKRNREEEPPNDAPTVYMGKLKPVMLSVDSKSIKVAHNESVELDENCFDEILFTGITV